jgi:hypothetical protein
MNKPQSERSSSGSRRLRRSLTEITMPTTRSVVLEQRSPAPPVPIEQPQLTIIPEPATEASATTATGLPQTKPFNGVGLDGRNESRSLEDVNSAAAQAAKYYRSWMFEHMKGNINASLGYASGLAAMSLSAGLDVLSVSGKRGQRKDPGISKLEKHVSAAEKTAAEFCSQAFELIATNVNSTLEFARRLGDVKSPAEFVVLSTSHARNQLELAVTHSAALRALSQPSAPTNAEQSNAGVAKELAGQK